MEPKDSPNEILSAVIIDEEIVCVPVHISYLGLDGIKRYIEESKDG